MDPETKQLLKESLEISKENNQLLRRMVRNQRWTVAYRVFYWSIIILSSLGAYYFIQPFLENLLNVYGVSDVNNVTDFTKNLGNNKQQIQDFINAIK